MQHFVKLWSVLLILLGAPAIAQERAVVVELFTSQGCSSCPPADAYLGKLTKDDAVIPLAFHVTYWDRLGWKDTFGDDRFTNRQYAYGKAFKNRSVWTPQFVIQGEHYSRDGFRNMVSDYVKAEKAAQDDAAMDVQVSGGEISVTIAPKSGSAKPAILQIIHYTPKETVSVKRGENAGRKLSYHNVVSDFYGLAEWDGRGQDTFNGKLRGKPPFAVVLQEPGAGPILAAQVVR